MLGRAAAVPSREHTEAHGQILDDDFSAQFVDVEFFDKRCAKGARNVEQEAAAIRRLDYDEIRNDFALRRQQRAETRRPGREFEEVGGDKPVEKISCAVAGNLDHAAVWEEGSLHAAHA